MVIIFMSYYYFLLHKMIGVICTIESIFNTINYSIIASFFSLCQWGKVSYLYIQLYTAITSSSVIYFVTAIKIRMPKVDNKILYGSMKSHSHVLSCSTESFWCVYFHLFHLAVLHGWLKLIQIIAYLLIWLSSTYPLTISAEFVFLVISLLW